MKQGTALPEGVPAARNWVSLFPTDTWHLPGLPVMDWSVKGDQMGYMRSEYAVGWGTLCLLNAGLAQSKGKSGLLWGILSLFLGPIATLLLVTLYAGDKR